MPNESIRKNTFVWRIGKSELFAIKTPSTTLLGDGVGVDESDLTNGTQFNQLDNVLFVLAAELIVALLADAEDFHCLALGEERVDALAGETDD